MDAELLRPPAKERPLKYQFAPRVLVVQRWGDEGGVGITCCDHPRRHNKISYLMPNFFCLPLGKSSRTGGTNG
jgi:hypothetical protein